jgi:hypothetical protein
MTTPTPDDLSVEARLSGIESRLSILEQHMRDHAGMYDQLRQNITWLRARLAHLLPEQRNCPKCGQIVHAKATSCRCGKTWNRADAAKAGLPT